MGKFEKLLLKILSGNADRTISFKDLQRLLLRMGFEERNRGGSHFIYINKQLNEMVNIQKDGSKAKPYQVKQIRRIFLKHKISKI